MKKLTIFLLSFLILFEISSLIFFKYLSFNQKNTYFKNFDYFDDKINKNIDPIKKYYNSPNYSINLGWDNSPYDERLNLFGARVDKLNEKKRMRIITFGSSMCWGDGVKHNETWPHYLSNNLNTYVANYGVGGYGPFQSYLKFKSLDEDLLKVDISILSIFEIEIDRIMNNYLDFYFSSGFRIRPTPYIEENKLKYNKLPNFSKSENFEKEFVNYIKLNSENDPWWSRRVEPTFPYSYQFIKLFNIILNDKYELNFFYDKSKNSWNNKKTNQALIKVIEEFSKFSKENNIKPYILLIPRIRYKLKSGYKYNQIKKYLIQNDYNVIDFGDFINNYEDKKNKNLILPDGHFSPRAYKLLAEFISKKIVIE